MQILFDFISNIMHDPRTTIWLFIFLIASILYAFVKNDIDIIEYEDEFFKNYLTGKKKNE